MSIRWPGGRASAALAELLLSEQPGLDPLGELDLLLGVEQRNLADLLEVVLDRVGGGPGRGDLGRGQVVVIVAVDERLVLTLTGTGPGRAGLLGGCCPAVARGRGLLLRRAHARGSRRERAGRQRVVQVPGGRAAAILILLPVVGVHLQAVDVREVAQVFQIHPFQGGLGRQVGLVRADHVHVNRASHILRVGRVQAGLVQASYVDRILRRIVTHAGCFIRFERGTMPRCSSPAATAHMGLRRVWHGFRRACHAVAPLLSLSVSGADRRRLAG